MSRVRDRLAAIVGRSHVAESRLFELAGPSGGAVAPAASPASTAEQAHLDGCTRCRGLIVGYRRADSVLGGAWIDRPLRVGPRAVEVVVPDRVARVRVGRSEERGSRGVARRVAIPVGMVAVLIGVVATAGLLTLRGGGLRPASSGPGGYTAGQTPGATAQATPERTGLVARLPLGQYGSFSWAPDGQHLLVRADSGSRVYDRFGNPIAEFGPIEGWLDATHLIGGDGKVADIHEIHQSGVDVYPWVVPNGHGSAAVIVAQPGCIGDPIIDWYRNGQFVKAGEKETPYGWSPDGKLLLLGHMSCTDQEAQMHGWKGPVDVVDFASGRVVATAPEVRGAMAFNPSGTRLAAESDKDLEILDFATGQFRTVPNARLLGWNDDDYAYCLLTSGSVALVGATAQMPPFNGIVAGGWAIPSSVGLRLEVDAAGAPSRIASADTKMTLLDLSTSSLVVRPDLALTVSSDQPRYSALLQSPWSPDGRMLALKSADGTSVALISVTDLPGSIADALPTPIGSPRTIAQRDGSALSGAVGSLVTDAKRNILWFLGGASAGPIDLYRYDVATAKLSKHAVAGTTYDSMRDRVAIAPTGELWIGAGSELIVYDPVADSQTSMTFPSSDPDIQTDPALGKPDPWIAGIAFDGTGRALIARNWVRSLAMVDASLHVAGRVDVSDGFAMTGGVFVAGGRVYVVADPESGFGFSVDATGAGKLSNTKFQATALAAVGDKVLAAGTPPGWLDPDGAGAAMIAPVMASADLVAGGPDGIAALYSNETGQLQLRDKDGKVSAQGVFAAGAAPRITTIAFDGQGRLWAVESADGDYSLVRLDFAP
jgi:WD40 repeat protein